MIKYKSLIMALCLGMVLTFAATPASATIIDVNYWWHTTGGTTAFDETGTLWTAGDVSGEAEFKVQEYWASGDERAGATYYPDHGMFKYDIHRLIPAEGNIFDFRVYNPFQVSYLGTRFVGPDGWTANHTATEWYWSTTTNPIDGVPGYFYIYTDAPRGIVDGSVSDYDGEHFDFASGRLSGPIPEPSSMLLLGMGLFGLGGAVRKRFKA